MQASRVTVLLALGLLSTTAGAIPPAEPLPLPTPEVPSPAPDPVPDATPPEVPAPASPPEVPAVPIPDEPAPRPQPPNPEPPEPTPEPPEPAPAPEPPQPSPRPEPMPDPEPEPEPEPSPTPEPPPDPPAPPEPDPVPEPPPQPPPPPDPPLPPLMREATGPGVPGDVALTDAPASDPTPPAEVPPSAEVPPVAQPAPASEPAPTAPPVATQPPPAAPPVATQPPPAPVEPGAPVDPNAPAPPAPPVATQPPPAAPPVATQPPPAPVEPGAPVDPNAPAPAAPTATPPAPPVATQPPPPPVEPGAPVDPNAPAPVAPNAPTAQPPVAQPTPALPDQTEVSGLAVTALRPSARSALFLRGFDVSWEARPHRVKALGFGVDAASDTPDAPPTGQIVAHVQGGSWASGEHATDTPEVAVEYGGLDAGSAPIQRGVVLARLSGEAPVMGAAEPARVVVPVEVPLPGAWDAAAPFLEGFHVATDAAHPEGFTPHALAVDVGPVRVDGGVARFDVTVEVQAAAVPDRDQHLRDYGAEVQVAWMLVPSSAARVHRLEASGGAEHGIEMEANAARVTPVDLTVATNTQADTTEVAAGLSGFRVAVDEAGIDAGRYLRALTVSLEPGNVDPFRRQWGGAVEMRFGNAGPVTRAEGVSLEAAVTVLELTDDQRAWSGRWTTTMTGPDATIAYPAPEQTGRR